MARFDLDRFAQSDDSSLGLNLIPLSDIIFNLLLFFLLASPLFFAPTIEVILPKTKSATQESPKETQNIILTITKSGHFFLGNRSVDKDDLPTTIRSILGGSRKVILALRADKETPYQNVVYAIDCAKGAGIAHLNLVTDLIKKGQ